MYDATRFGGQKILKTCGSYSVLRVRLHSYPAADLWRMALAAHYVQYDVVAWLRALQSFFLISCTLQ